MTQVTQAIYDECKAYVENAVEDFDLRYQLSLGHMERMRCPMDRDLREDIESSISDFVSDYAVHNDMTIDEIENMTDTLVENMNEMWFC